MLHPDIACDAAARQGTARLAQAAAIAPARAALFGDVSTGAGQS